MAFDRKFLGRVNTSANDDSLRMWIYNATATGSNEVLATIAAAGYFDDVQAALAGDNGPMRVGDVIFGNASDARAVYAVTAATTQVTVAVY